MGVRGLVHLKRKTFQKSCPTKGAVREVQTKVGTRRAGCRPYVSILGVLDLKVQFTDVVRTLRIYNVYNPPPRSKQDNTGPSTLPDLDKDFQESPCEHSMVFGDFNLHHPLWGGRTLLSQHAYADKLIDITEEHNLVQLTLPGTITYSQNGESTIDLAFATSGIANMLV